jgi:hypothetical protein
MPDTLAFSTFDDVVTTSPENCALCKAELAVFAYQISSDEPGFQQLEGFCCLKCGTSLLASLESIVRATRDRHNSGRANPSDTEQN